MSSLWHELRFRRDHRWTPPHMSAYLDSDLRMQARARLEHHTAECPECRSVLGELRLRGDEWDMDAGCGSGKLTRLLVDNLPRGHVFGVDLSRNMALHARENLDADFSGRVRFVVADLVALPFRQCFDGIFSTASFHWIGESVR